MVRYKARVRNLMDYCIDPCGHCGIIVLIGFVAMILIGIWLVHDDKIRRKKLIEQYAKKEAERVLQDSPFYKEASKEVDTIVNGC